jgi:hypothetical protein
MQLVQQHLRTEMLRRQAIAEQPEQQNADGQENSDDDNETVVMEEQQQQQQENPWGPQF